MKKTIKITITLFLILLILTPVLFFVIYPNYNNIITKYNSFDIQALSKETTISIYVVGRELCWCHPDTR